MTGQVRAYDLLRTLGREGRLTQLRQVFMEYGRIAKTLHLLRVVDPVDGAYRRQMSRQLTVQESHRKLARDICHGRRGQIMQAYHDSQENQLGSLGLVLNAAVLWTTRYLDAAVAALRELPAEQREHAGLDQDVARLSPLRHANLNVLGRYSFRASSPAGGELRPCATRPRTRATTNPPRTDPPPRALCRTGSGMRAAVRALSDRPASHAPRRFQAVTWGSAGLR